MKIPFINGLRGYCILAVICFHLLWSQVDPANSGFSFRTGFGFLDTPDLGIHLSLFAPITNGWLSVNLFFILSGFVLSLPFFSGNRDMSTRQDALAFYVTRLKRLYPLFAIAVVVGIVFYNPPGKITQLIPQTFLILTGLFVLVPKYFFPDSNFVLWSLGVEIWFSILFPGILILSKRIRWFTENPWRLYYVSAFFCLIVRTIGMHPAFSSQNYLNPIKDSVFGRLDDFVLGILLAHRYLKMTSEARTNPGSPWLKPVAGIILIWSVFIIQDSVFLRLLPKLLIPLNYTIFQIGTFLIMDSLLVLHKSGRVLIGFTNWPVQMLGLMCYSMYLWHGILHRKLFSIGGGATGIIAYILFLLGFSFMTYRWIEFGSEKTLSKLLPQKRA